MLCTASTPVEDAHEAWMAYRVAAEERHKSPGNGKTINDLRLQYKHLIGTKKQVRLNRRREDWTPDDLDAIKVVVQEYREATHQRLVAQLLHDIGYISTKGKPMSASLVQKFEESLSLRRSNVYCKLLYNVNHTEATKLRKAPGKDLYHYVEKLNTQAVYDLNGPRYGVNIRKIRPTLTGADWAAINACGPEYAKIISEIEDKLWRRMQIAINMGPDDVI